MDEQKIVAPKPIEGKAWDVAIIGSGPASLTAAIYTTRGAASTIIIGGEKWGGQLMLTNEVDNFPSQPSILGPELMQKMKDHSLLFGAEFVQKNVESVDFSTKPFTLVASGQKYLANTVIVGTGADTKWLGVPGEEKLLGRGVSSCAPCDAPFFKEKKVVVIGGGDSAMEEALVLTKYATLVTMVHRKNSFRASIAMQKKVLGNPRIKVVWDTTVVEFVGEQKLEKIILENTKTKQKSEFATDGAFVAIGHKPSTNIFKGKIELDQKGYIVKHTRDGYNMATSIDGVFVAGDVHDYHYRQAITAAGFGCMAGMDAVKYLDNFKEKTQSS